MVYKVMIHHRYFSTYLTMPMSVVALQLSYCNRKMSPPHSPYHFVVHDNLGDRSSRPIHMRCFRQMQQRSLTRCTLVEEMFVAVVTIAIHLSAFELVDCSLPLDNALSILVLEYVHIFYGIDECCLKEKCRKL